MNQENRSLEWQVGLFVLTGLLVVGALVVTFGRFGQALRPRYSLTVEFPNASGLLRNSKVLMSGAYVGNVTTSPKVLDHARGISVELRVDQQIQIPRTAAFVVGSNGLLGDRFVDIVLRAEETGEFFHPGDRVRGERQAGVDDLTRVGGLLLGDLRTAVGNLNGILVRLDQQLLNPATLQKLDASLTNLEGASRSFRDSSEKIGGLVGDVRGAVGDARRTVNGAGATLGTAQKAAEDLRGAIADTRKVLTTTRRTVEEATAGRGVIASLLGDRQLADNLNALVANLRRSGLLFYKDRAGAAPPLKGPAHGGPGDAPPPSLPPRRN